MKVKWLVGALVVLVVLNLSLIGAFMFAHFHDGHHGGGREWRMHHRWSGERSEERRRLFRTMRSFHEEVRPVVEETERLEADLIASMGKDPVPQAHIDSLLTQISEKRLEVARRATRHMIALGDSLSPSDRERLTKALTKMHRGRWSRGERHNDDDSRRRR